MSDQDDISRARERRALEEVAGELGETNDELEAALQDMDERMRRYRETSAQRLRRLIAYLARLEREKGRASEQE